MIQFLRALSAIVDVGLALPDFLRHLRNAKILQGSRDGCRRQIAGAKSDTQCLGAFVLEVMRNVVCRDAAHVQARQFTIEDVSTLTPFSRRTV